jgi:hypothetical protein
MELAPELVDEKGKVDIAKAIDHQAELNIAIVEVESYVRFTKEAAAVLGRLGCKKPDDDWDDDEDPGDEDDGE